jgi:hypothetical protein
MAQKIGDVFLRGFYATGCLLTYAEYDKEGWKQ